MINFYLIILVKILLLKVYIRMPKVQKREIKDNAKKQSTIQLQ